MGGLSHAAAIPFFKHPVTFSLFVLLASALFVEHLNERQRSKCIFYECVPLVYLPLWGLCIQSKPALEEKSAFSSPVPRCQRQGKLWLWLAFWYAFQTGENFTTIEEANLQWRFFFYYYYRSLLRKAKQSRVSSEWQVCFPVMISANLRSVLFCSLDSLT